MSAREQLHAFVEQLPEEQLTGALRVLEAMQAKVAEDPMLAMLLNAPEDDEPLTEEEQRILEVSLAEADRGETIPWETVRKELGRMARSFDLRSAQAPPRPRSWRSGTRSVRPDGIGFGMGRKLGWDAYADANNRLFKMPPLTLAALAKQIETSSARPRSG